MKRFIILLLFVLGYAFLFSLGTECLLNLLGLFMALSLDGEILHQYPRFIPFCMIVALLVLAVTVILLIYQFYASEKLGVTKKMWYVQFLSAVVIAIPMIELWEILFAFLRKIF